MWREMSPSHNYLLYKKLTSLILRLGFKYLKYNECFLQQVLQSGPLIYFSMSVQYSSHTKIEFRQVRFSLYDIIWVACVMTPTSYCDSHIIIKGFLNIFLANLKDIDFSTCLMSRVLFFVCNEVRCVSIFVEFIYSVTMVFRFISVPTGPMILF